MKKLYTIAIALFLTLAVNAQDVIYANDFENGVGAATIVGNGAIETVTTPGFNHVFHNAVTGQAVRTNYLLLSDTVFAALQRSNSYKLSIAFWVNKSTATNYFFTPLFSAYKAAPDPTTGNTWPMMVLQSRLLAQINCAGWTDFTNMDNVTGTNKESTDWMIKTDSVWHYYTATFDTLKVKVYVDGVIQNEWNCDGTFGHTVKGLFTNGSELKYICLGGNQAWGWNDVDAAFCYDDLAIYSDTLSVAQIKDNIAAKLQTRIKSGTSESISVFPNPTSNFVTVIGISGKAKIVVTDLNGKMVSSKEITSGEQVSLAGFAKGTYLIKIITKGSTSIKKVSVK